MRVDANVSVRPVGDDDARHPVRDQEPQLAAVARPGHRLRGPSPDRPARGRRAGRAGDPPLGRGRRAARTPCRSKEEAYDYRYFPEPDLVPLEPEADWVDGGRRRAARSAGGPAGRRWPRRPASTPRRVAIVVDRGHDDLADGAIGRRGRRPHRRSTRSATTCRPTSTRLDADPASPHSCAMETAGELTATQAKQVLAEMVADRRRSGRHRRGPGLRGHGHAASSRPWSTRSSPRTPTSGPSSSTATTRPGQAHRLLRRPGHEGHARARPTARRSPRSCARRPADDGGATAARAGRRRLRRLRPRLRRHSLQPPSRPSGRRPSGSWTARGWSRTGTSTSPPPPPTPSR